MANGKIDHVKITHNRNKDLPATVFGMHQRTNGPALKFW